MTMTLRTLVFPAILLLFVSCSNAQEQKPEAVPPVPPKTEAPQPAPAVAVAAPPQEAPVPVKPAAPASPRPTKTNSVAPKPSPAPTPTNTPEPKEAPKPSETPKVISAPAPVATSVAPSSQPISHAEFDALLQKHVSASGKVNYKGIKADKASLDTYCQLLTDNPPQDDWSRAEKMAYWINAYNAFTIKLITENYPTKSIMNFDGGKTWDVRRIRIGDKKYSLNNIENDILRPTYKDPRIHFAVNCAAQSCPPIWNHAFTAENLETALADRTKTFVNNSAFNTLSGSKAQVSKIFDWYAVDFGNLREFLNQYADTPLKSNATIRFNEYNWELNE